jgi:hypothetical protein
MSVLDEAELFDEDLAQLARLAISGRSDDVRLFVARLVRKHRGARPELAVRLEDLLRTSQPARSHSPLRKSFDESPSLPVDGESRLSLLKSFENKSAPASPLLNQNLLLTFGQLIEERRQILRLQSLGLTPTKSVFFVGPPGVGKTITARWLASQLQMPFYVLDLTNVMSSLLGKTGANLRAVLDFARQKPCVLLLDEIDAVAKRRNDESDIGELKRLVTVMLQEVEEWPASGLLIAATNHPELIDPALWRRFDSVIKFDLPDFAQRVEAIASFSRPVEDTFSVWKDALAYVLEGSSFSDIDRVIQRLRRSFAIGISPIDTSIKSLLKTSMPTLTKEQRIKVAQHLAGQFSQRVISEITGIARDTLRKNTTLALSD